MTRSRDSDEELARLTRQIAAKAARRLDYLEWLILAGAALAAVVGGFLVALLLAEVTDLNVRTLWVVASLFLFGVPGSIALARARKEERARQSKNIEHETTDSDG